MLTTKLLLSSAIGAAVLAIAVEAAAQPPSQPPPQPESAQPAPSGTDEAQPATSAPKRQEAKEESEEKKDDDEPGGSFFFSTNGPGSGKTQGVAGAGALIASGVGGPGITLGVNHGIGDAADFQLRGDLAVIPTGRDTAVAGIVDPHFLVRLLGQRNMGANVGLKLGPEIIWVAEGGGGIAIFGIVPGITSSFGTAKFQASVNVDFPVYFAIAGSFSGSGASGTVRPSIGLEGNVGGSTNLFLRVAPQFSLSGGEGYILTALTGLTF